MSAPTTFIVTENHQTHQTPPAAKAGSSGLGGPLICHAGSAAETSTDSQPMGSELFSSLGDVTVTTLQGTHDQRLKLLNQQLGPNRLSPNRTSPSPEPVTRSHPRGSPPSLGMAK